MRKLLVASCWLPVAGCKLLVNARAGRNRRERLNLMSTDHPSSAPANRLARESSPYLLQHAHNPVDWFPWGPEAFEKARAENKPIFLSVGYSTCYWCHVMERESFENPAVAEVMNALFVNIKVDREERPDVDQLYMLAVQILTRQGGWPMSVFLTPDLRPFFGGTYYPPVDTRGRPGFVTLLRGIDDAFHNRPGDVEQAARRLVDILSQHAAAPAPREPIQIDEDAIEALIRRSTADYDSKWGGFGGAPKFPRETLLELLLAYTHQTVPPSSFKSRVMQMACNTLDAMAAGGIRDQLGGGFHRYSTDEHWLVPHFEIMLYDNAMLGWCYAEAYAQTLHAPYAAVARGIFDFILREMTSPAGGFFTAIDAEVDGQEGLNYLWKSDEIDLVLGQLDGRLFRKAYGVDRGPNFADPHHGIGVRDKNILFLPQPLDELAGDLRLEPAALEGRLAEMRQRLLQARMKRKQPILDDKIITSWNALMIRALAHGGLILGEPRYGAAAEKAAGFLLRAHRTPEGDLLRSSRSEQPRHAAFLDDYACLAQALLKLANVTGNEAWRTTAADLARRMTEKFGDASAGGFFFTEAAARDLIVRQKVATDSPLPNGNAVAAMVLLELGETGAARRTLDAFAELTDTQTAATSSMAQATLELFRAIGPYAVEMKADVQAEDRPLSAQQVAEGVVSAAARRKTPSEIYLELRILRGFHINAHDVPRGQPVIATSVRVVDDPEATVEYPQSQALRAAFQDEPLRVFSGTVVVVIRPSAAAGRLPTKLSVTYQACDDSACLPPVTREVEVE